MTDKSYNAAILTRCYVQHFLSPYIVSEVNHNITANTKALTGCLCALSVNKLSHIPKLQAISAVYENQWCRIRFRVFIELSAF